MQVVFSLREKWANREPARPAGSELDSDYGVALIGLLLAEREGYLRADQNPDPRNRHVCQPGFAALNFSSTGT
jgi:hypothetical protein